MSVDANLIERLRAELEVFVDGSDRTPAQAQRVATAVLDALPADDTTDAFLTTVTIFGDPDCPFFRTEEEMVKECLDLRRYLANLG